MFLLGQVRNNIALLLSATQAGRDDRLCADLAAAGSGGSSGEALFCSQEYYQQKCYGRLRCRFVRREMKTKNFHFTGKKYSVECTNVLVFKVGCLIKSSMFEQIFVFTLFQ